MLEAFCRYANRDPDQIIKETTMIKDGEKRIRTKGRERYAAPHRRVAGDESKARASEGRSGATPSAASSSTTASCSPQGMQPGAE